MKISRIQTYPDYKKNSTVTTKINTYNYSNNSAQSFNGIGDKIINIFRKKTPFEQAKQYIIKGNKADYLDPAYNYYVKASNTLLANWNTLNKQGQLQYVQAMYGIAACGVRYSVKQGLNAYQSLMSTLEVMRSPLLKDQKMLKEVTSKAYKLGNFSIVNGDIQTARNCFKFCQKIAEHTKNTINVEFYIGKEKATDLLNKKINHIDELIKK